MAMHLYAVGNHVVSQIDAVLNVVASDRSGDETVSREALKPYVQFRKRRAGRGREEGLMRIGEGITVIPLKPTTGRGTNVRDDVGYRFLITIVAGTLTDSMSDDWQIGIWEQAIRQRFQSRRTGVVLTDACEMYCVIEPGDLPDWAMLDDGVDASYLTLTVFIRESRYGVVS